jgi:alpha-galactosidase
VPSTVPNDLDEAAPFCALLPEHSSGWNGRPGLRGSRSGRGWSPQFVPTGFQATADPAGGGRIVATGVDEVAGLTLVIELELLPSGLVRQRASVTATTEGAYQVDGLALTLPVPAVATELFDLAGRWGRERSPQRLPFVVGVHSRESRRGRTGPDAPLILAAGTAGFDTRRGEVWAVHVAWSGNHVTYAERLSTGFAVLGGGELLLPGEITLAAGEGYTGPWVYAAHGVGLDGLAARFHTYLRARPHHPRRPRPVVMNTWEAVYFDHDLGRLTELAALGAEVGVERYVLDDGWFRHRRDDSAGLGAGTWTRTSGPTACTRWWPPCAGSAWSSGCGSSRRWSTWTPTSPEPIPTGCSAPVAGHPCRRAASRCSTSAIPTPTPTSSNASTPC